MAVRRLDHYNVLTTSLQGTLAFYADVLEMKVGPPPSGDTVRGAWIYDDEGSPIVHVQAVDPARAEVKFADIRRRLGSMIGPLSLERLNGSGTVEHLALQCDDYERVKQRCEDRGIPLRTNLVERTGTRQIFICDPNGIVLELNFPKA